ncbi:hypothetical protein SAMN05444166_7970 [Singulisphaera sp. GP187]|uniref:DUF6798 domain-containing protein n=1 Tax=Singulisphaera sp. GP187 TaxID=1882752 RepID=UPI00092CE0C1|nr:DUF6798 domain-containing protein [Singulisphaera sp. GP187]SIO66131.1 hypothetical protein SAMN05444166_7970 [Singulisphaera sp. GP187]
MLEIKNPTPGLPKWLAFVLIFGLFLTLRGYHSRDGDQAYRLPLLLHRQDTGLFADDPFVRAFDAFNPHRGYLTLLDLASRPLGLSTGLAALFALTFALTCLGLDRLARAVWPEAGPHVGIVAVVLVLIAKAGNVGTNHLFEAMLLDRLIGFALGWLALAAAVENPARGWRTAAPLLGLAMLIHPSVGLQLAMLLGAGWVGWALCSTKTAVSRGVALRGLAALGLAVGPGLLMNLGQGSKLFAGLSTEDFRLLSVELQGPQHMLPHLWRTPQWLAWSCYIVLALLAFLQSRPAEGRNGTSTAAPAARIRLAILLGLNLLGLAVAWVAVEWVQDLRATLFQPFRMATVFRGLALVAVSGRLVELWSRGTWAERARATLLTVGLAGDWAFVVATLVEVACTALERTTIRPAIRLALAGTVLGLGLYWLTRHDTESGHLPMLAAIASLTVLTFAFRGRSLSWNRRRLVWALAGSWAVPLLALGATGEALRGRAWATSLVDRCRFAAVPVDDIERLAVWCRDHTPRSARFIGPPGPKTFRLWSLRSLAFNRAGSPYHAEGLADWSARFRDHVGFDGPDSTFVRAYLTDRHGLERRYQAMSDAERARLATRQGASHIVAAAPSGRATMANDDGPLELIHVEGRYAVYRVRPSSATDQVTLRDSAP